MAALSLVAYLFFHKNEIHIDHTFIILPCEFLNNVCLSTLADAFYYKRLSVLNYLMIFKYGMPPHGGLGIGLERLTMRLLDEQNVRETSLFPRDVTRLEP